MVTLNRGAINRVSLIVDYIRIIFPLVKQELNGWQKVAAQMPDDRLSKQAIESIRTKAFHCQGGSIYALYPGVDINASVQFIVAYQTISDYLDNLVDSLHVQDEKAFSQLHLAMHEALDPWAVPSDYYRYYPYQEDGGYLLRLVKICQQNIAKLPSYKLVQEEGVALAKLYSSLQTYKHLSNEDREEKMLNWIKPYITGNSEISTWEFAAASGSTLGVFCLYAAAYNPYLAVTDGQRIKQAYFPWICGLHILLDYFIDLREDRETNQLNFVAYYKDIDMVNDRLQLFIKNSLNQGEMLEYPRFHRTVVQGLLAMYLSDDKSGDQEIRLVSKQLLQKSGWGVTLLYGICRLLRIAKKL